MALSDAVTDPAAGAFDLTLLGSASNFSLGSAADGAALFYSRFYSDPDGGSNAFAGAQALSPSQGVASAPSGTIAPLPSDSALADLPTLANPPAGTVEAANTDSAIGSNGATGAQVQQALDATGLSVNGTGIRVGVLSDSFNDLGGAAADEADGALPPAADIDVIKDLASGGTDEGRAMMQIIHDIAPGASLAFYTAFDGEQDFANGILALAAAGCKVIVDDVSYYDEPFFQNGVVAQAIQTVEAEGVTYVTAAGNDASNGYQAAWTPISGAFSLAGQTVSLTDAESFGGTPFQTISINTESTGDDVPLVLEWNQAYGSVSSGTADLEILVFNSSGKLVGTATNASNGEPTNPWVEYDFTKTGTYYVAIENLDTGTNPGLIKEITEGDGLPATISDSNSGTVVGHAMTPGAITTGAVSTADTPAFGVNPPVSESFSSSGAGAELLFADNGTPLSSPDMLSPVVVSGVDDINTTVRGGLSDFYGTSAASASIAGVVALMLQENPDLTPAQVEQILEESATPFGNSAVAGAGLANAAGAVPLGTAVTDDFYDNLTSDILFRNPSSGNLGMYVMNDGTPTWQGLDWADPSLQLAGTGDFFGNGTDDILFFDPTTGQLGMFAMNNGTPTWEGIPSVATNWQVAGIGDFFGNGTDDILFRDPSTGNLGMYVMNDGTPTWQGLDWADPSFQVGGTGDFFGNGTDDILFFDPTTGQLGMFAMHNGAPTWEGLGSVATNWKVASA